MISRSMNNHHIYIYATAFSHPKTPQKLYHYILFIPHNILLYIYLDLVVFFSSKCRPIYHTWLLWCYGYKCNYKRELCFGSLPSAFPSQGIQHGLPVSAMPLIWGMAEPNRTGNRFGVGLHGNVANSLV